jgi:hypothetical protein
MSEQTPATPVATKKNPGHRFELGHQRFGGKRKNSTQQVRDLCTEMGVEPMQFMLELIKNGVTTQVVIENGKKRRVEVAVSLEMRVDLAKYVSRFIHPTLTATQVTGNDLGPIAVAGLDLTRLIQDPALVDLMQRTAIAMAQADRELAPADEPEPTRMLPAGDDTV